MVDCCGDCLDQLREEKVSETKIPDGFEACAWEQATHSYELVPGLAQPEGLCLLNMEGAVMGFEERGAEAATVFVTWLRVVRVAVTQDNYNPEGLAEATTIKAEPVVEITGLTKPVFTVDAIERVREKRCPSSWCGCHVDEMLGVLTMQDLRDALGEK